MRVYFGPAGARSPGEPVAGVEAPQAVVAIDPRVVVADQDRRPVDVATGADRDAVAAGVVDERDARARAWPSRRGHPGPAGRGCRARSAAVRSSGPRMFRSPGNGSRMMYSPCSRYVGVRPGARVDDRVAVDRSGAAGRPSDAAGRRPSRRGPRHRTRPAPACRRRAASRTTKHCSQSASWSLAPSNVRAPVVHGVEEHVVEDDPATLADRPGRGRRRVGSCARIAVVSDAMPRRPCRPARGREAEARRRARRRRAVRQPDPGEPARRREHLAIRPVPPARAARAHRAAPARTAGTAPGRAAGRRRPRAVRGPARRRGSRRAPRAASALRGGRSPRRTTRRPSGRTARHG